MNPPTNPTTSSTTIEDLPPEMISELFKHLHLRDLTTCSMVNKRWNSIYANFKSVDSLIAICSYGFIPKRWFHSNRQIEEKELSSGQLFRRLVDRPLLSNLKQLAICSEPSEFDLNKLNLFRELIHLEIGDYAGHCPQAEWRPIERKVVLNLPKLSVLAIHSIMNFSSPMVVDCPMLKVFAGDLWYEEKQTIKLKYPETIRKLETWMYASELVPFKNVECLMANNFYAISRDILLRLPKLKELHYKWGFDLDGFGLGAFFGSEVGTLDNKKRELKELLDDVKTLKGDHFKFIYGGFPLTKKMLDQIDFGLWINEKGNEMFSTEYLYAKNYPLLECDAINFDWIGDYNLLLQNFSGEFPNCFFRTFTTISWLKAKGPVADSKHFLWFLKCLPSLRKLVLEDTGLGQKFLDQLPASARLLNELEVDDYYNDSELLNFEFVGRFSFLVSFKIVHQRWTLESVTQLVRLTFDKHVRGSFTFGLENHSITILKDKVTKWKTCIFDITVGLSRFKERSHPDEIIKWLEGIPGRIRRRERHLKYMARLQTAIRDLRKLRKFVSSYCFCLGCYY